MSPLSPSLPHPCRHTSFTVVLLNFIVCITHYHPFHSQQWTIVDSIFSWSSLLALICPFAYLSFICSMFLFIFLISLSPHLQSQEVSWLETSPAHVLQRCCVTRWVTQALCVYLEHLTCLLWLTTSCSTGPFWVCVSGWVRIILPWQRVADCVGMLLLFGG